MNIMVRAYESGLKEGRKAEANGLHPDTKRVILSCYGDAAENGDFSGLNNNGRDLHIKYGDKGAMRLHCQGVIDGITGNITCPAFLSKESV